jgi:quinol monooxygenase YgiN
MESGKNIIHVIATMEVKEGKRDAFLAEFHKVQPKVLAEVGCIQYEPAIDIKTAIPVQAPVRDHHIAIIEKWESLEALYTHL